MNNCNKQANNNNIQQITDLGLSVDKQSRYLNLFHETEQTNLIFQIHSSYCP